MISPKNILIATALILSAVFGFLFREGCKAKKELKDVKVAAKLDAQPAKVYRDKDSIQHIAKEVDPVSKETAGILFKAKWEQAAKDLQVARNQIEELTNLNMDLRAKLLIPTTPVAPGDTSAPKYATKSFTYADSSIIVNGYILETPVDSTCKGDSCLTQTEAQLDISASVEGKVRKYWERKHRLPIFKVKRNGVRVPIMWGKKINFIDVSSNDKRIIITGLEHIQINH